MNQFMSYLVCEGFSSCSRPANLWIPECGTSNFGVRDTKMACIAKHSKHNDKMSDIPDFGTFLLSEWGTVLQNVGHLAGLHVLLKYCYENAEMQKRKFDDITLQYSIDYLSWPLMYTSNIVRLSRLVYIQTCINMAEAFRCKLVRYLTMLDILP